MRHFGLIKWFGGYNNKTGSINNFGFIEHTPEDDIYVNRNEIKFSFSDDRYLEGKAVTFEVEESMKYGKLLCRAVDVILLKDETEKDPLIEAFLAGGNYFSRSVGEELFSNLSEDDVHIILERK